MKRSIWIGFDPREKDAVEVCLASIRAHITQDIPIFVVALDVLRKRGLYYRQTEIRHGRLWDKVSDAPMSTEFAISRFFLPHFTDGGQAIFMDCDMLVRADLCELFDSVDPDCAISVVQHDHRAADGIKMDGQIQTAYPRKNWSSVMVWNLDHKAHRLLDLRYLNTVPGRFLHAFGWLMDSEIGALDPAWNHLVGVADPDPLARIVHFTLGIPRMHGYEDCEHAAEWWEYGEALGMVRTPEGVISPWDLNRYQDPVCGIAPQR